jgi:hypothetical protein
MSSPDERLDVDRLGLQRRDPDRHRQRHETVDLGGGSALAGFPIGCIVHGNNRMAHAHRKHRMTAVGEVTFKENLLQISQSRAHARHTLTEFNEALLDQLLAETRPEKPRLQVTKIPTIEGKPLHVVALKYLTQILATNS